MTYRTMDGTVRRAVRKSVPRTADQVRINVPVKMLTNQRNQNIHKFIEVPE
jgi:hypothetical protein